MSNSAPSGRQASEVHAVTDRHFPKADLEGPNEPLRRSISNGERNAWPVAIGVVLLVVTEAIQLLWIQLYAFGASWAEADAGEPPTGLDPVPAMLGAGLLLLLIGFVACMAGSPRGTLVGALSGLTITAIGTAITATAYWPDIASAIDVALMLGLPGLLLLAYAWAMRRYLSGRKTRSGPVRVGDRLT